MRVLRVSCEASVAANFGVLGETEPHDDPFVRNNPMMVYYR